MGSFEFSSQKWNDYYAYCDRIKEEKQREENRFFRLVHPIDYSKPLASIRSWVQNPFFASLCFISCVFFPVDINQDCLPSLSDYLKLNGMELSAKPTLPTVYSSLSLPSLDPVPEDEVEGVTQPSSLTETQERTAADVFNEQSGDKAMLSPVHDETEEEPSNRTTDSFSTHFGLHSLPFYRTLMRTLSPPELETAEECPKPTIPCSTSTLMGRIEVEEKNSVNYRPF